MIKGHFYFISDEFYEKYDPEKKLMRNREEIGGKPHARPCFFAFNDKQHPEIVWLVPISSKVEKYRRIYDSKIDRQLRKGIPSPKCNTIRFGKVLGKERAFLIQNMFPVTEKYVCSPYIDRNTSNEVTIDPGTEKDIIRNAEDVLKLAFRGIPILFADIQKIYGDLISEVAVIKTKGPVVIGDEKSIMNRLQAATAEVERRDQQRDGTIKKRDTER